MMIKGMQSDRYLELCLYFEWWQGHVVWNLATMLRPSITPPLGNQKNDLNEWLALTLSAR
jgi:hypothetical protein